MSFAADIFSVSIGQNYISFADFIVYLMFSRIVSALFLTDSYFPRCRFKSFIVGLLLLKDIAVIFLSLAAGTSY